MLKKLNRIRKTADIDAFFGKQFKQVRGRSAASKLYVLKVKNNNLNTIRVGFIVNTKVDKRAVVRNKAKRRLRDIFIKNLHELKKGQDLLVIVQKPAANAEYSEIKTDMLRLLQRVGAVK
jgi:ribonuclease P protein component